MLVRFLAELLMLLDFAREENQTLVTALRGCSRLNGGEKIDAEIQTAPDTKDASTDAEPFAAELDENAPTRIAVRDLKENHLAFQMFC